MDESPNTNDTPTQTEQPSSQEIPIALFDGTWKESGLRDRETNWFEIVIENNTIKIYWAYDTDANGVYENPAEFNGTWKNPDSDVTEYEYTSRMNTGYYIDGEGNRTDYYLDLKFTYANGKLSVYGSDIPTVSPSHYEHGGQIVYFEKIN